MLAANPPQPIKVMLLHVPHYLGPSWEVYRNLVNALDTTRIEMHVIINERCPELGLVDRAGVFVQRIDFHYRSFREGLLAHIRRAARLFSVVPRLVRYARREPISVIHANEDGWSVLYGWLIARISGARLLVHYHSMLELRGRARIPVIGLLTRGTMRFLARRADYNVGVSRFLAEEIAKLDVPQDRVGFVHNSIDLQPYSMPVDGSTIRRELGIAEDVVLVLQVSRLWRRKRQEDLISAIAIARQTCDRLHCLIVGWDDPEYDGPFPSYRAELEELCRTKNVADMVTIWKARPDVPQMNAAADIVVLPSVGESFGLVIAEAMASRRPTVAARSGGIPEIIEDGVTGYLVAPLAPEEIADCLTRLALDPELRARIGARARAFVVEHFSAERLARDFESLYLAVCEDAPVPAALAVARA